MPPKHPRFQLRYTQIVLPVFPGRQLVYIPCTPSQLFWAVSRIFSVLSLHGETGISMYFFCPLVGMIRLERMTDRL